VALGRRGIPGDDAIHHARLHIKKARAALRLLPRWSRKKPCRKAKLALRSVSKTLRRSRDSAVAREALATVARRAPHLKSAIQTLEQSWRRHEGAGHALSTAHDCRRARMELGRAAILVHEGASTQWRAEELLLALGRTYRRAYRAYHCAARTQSERAWHECRKQTKCLCYQLVFTGASRRLHGMLRQAQLLESTLGKLRDLALLARQIRRRTVETDAGADRR
jgi:CHAD domain